MAETSGFFDAEELVGGGYDREYVAEQWANYFKLFISNGVFVTPTNQLKVVSNSGMTVIVMAGWAWINGYWYNNSANYTLTIPANTSAATKKHGIFVQFDSGERTIKLVVGNERTTVNRTAPYYELKLAEITVAPGVSAITTADITDTRGNSSVCGFVTGVVDVIDTGDLFAQFTAIFNNFLSTAQTYEVQQQAAFETWFNAMKDQLTTDAAGHLQTEIDNLEEALTGEVVDTEAYALRQGKGNMVDLDLVGGSVAWNQLIEHGNFDATTGWGGNRTTLSASGNKCTVTLTDSATSASAYRLNVFDGKSSHVFFACVTATSAKATTLGLQIGQTIPTKAISANTRTIFSAVAKASNNVTDGTFHIFVNRNGNLSANDTVILENVNLIDLTALFGTTIADYIYSLEQSTAGAGVAWFRQYFPNAYYAYNVGEIKSVNPSKRVIVGFNLWNELSEFGRYDTSTGAKITDSYTKRNANPITVLPNKEIYLYSNVAVRYFEYDSNGNYLGNNVMYSGGGAFTTRENTAYINIQFGLDCKYVCINISKTTGTPKNGDYVPYNGSEFPFDSSKQLRGVPKLVNNKLSYDGDIYRADGSVTRKYGIVDLGTLTWTKTSTTDNHYRFSSSGISSIVKKPNNSVTQPNIICGKYITVTPDDTWEYTKVGISIHHTSGDVLVSDLSYSDAAAFKTAMSGVYLVYELKTPTTESATPFQNPQRAFTEGIEEFIDYGVDQSTRDVSIPVGIDARYYLSEVLPAAEDYTDGAGEQINTAITALQGDIVDINTAILALNAMYDGKAPSSTTNLNTPLTLGSTKFAVHRFANSTTNAPTSGSGIVLTWSKDANNGAQLVIAEDTMFYRRRNSGVNDSWQTLDFVTNLESTKTLSTTTSTTYTFSSSMITANSAIDVYTDIFGVIPSNVSVSAGSCTVTFPPYTSATSMKCRIAVRR